MSKKLTKREDDYSSWYNELVVKADLAENSSVRGCMVCLLYTSPSPRDGLLSRMPSSA